MTTNEFHVERISRVEKRYHRRFEKSENEDAMNIGAPQTTQVQPDEQSHPPLIIYV